MDYLLEEFSKFWTNCYWFPHSTSTCEFDHYHMLEKWDFFWKLFQNVDGFSRYLTSRNISKSNCVSMPLCKRQVAYFTANMEPRWSDSQVRLSLSWEHKNFCGKHSGLDPAGPRWFPGMWMDAYPDLHNNTIRWEVPSVSDSSLDWISSVAFF